MNEQKIREILIKRGNELLARPFEQVRFTGDAQADALLNDLDHYPHAFVLACVMDRQIKAERAWLIPHAFSTRIGSFEFRHLERLSKARVKELFTEPEPLHRFPEVMSANFYRAVQRIERDYFGDASGIWAGTSSSATIVRRFLEFDGVGPKIANMAANILVRDFKIPVSDKISIDISPDVQVRRAFTRLGLIREGASNEEITYRARELNPTYPGIFDLSVWEIGRNWCRPKLPECQLCYMNSCCQTTNR
ncbi:MAG: iron-sulfur cluster loop [Anaerolineae bacterium]|nr:iron-sulfur cluster loop [Anaerolineae bacterium]